MRFPNYVRTSLAAGALVALLTACTGAGDSPSPAAPGSPGASPTVTAFEPSPTSGESPTVAPTEDATPTLAPEPTQTSRDTPATGTATPPNGTAGNECANVPTFAPGGPEPSFVPDDELEAFFPESIDGNPVTDMQSVQWIQFICLFGGQAAVDELREETEQDFNLIDLSFATANVTLGDEEVEMAAFRHPATEEGRLLDNLTELMRSRGEVIGEIHDLETGSVGGKQVVWWTDAGERIYAYESGDILFSIQGVTEAQAEQIFSSLP